MPSKKQNTSPEKVQIINDLKFFDLSQKEVDIYLAALELGPASIQQITNKTGLVRTSVVYYIDSLLDKGFFNETIVRKRKFYIAIHPEKIKDIYKLKRVRFEQTENKLESIIDRINSFCPQLNNSAIEMLSPNIYYFEGEKGLIKIYEDTLQSQENMCAFTAWDNMLHVLPKYLPAYVKRRTAANIHSNCIAVDSPISRKIAKRDDKECRHTKFLKSKDTLSVETMIYGDKIALVSFEGELGGIIIENETLAKAQKIFFDALWEKL